MGYFYKVEGLYKQDANKVAECINGLGDNFTMQDVVTMAKPKDHYMHSMFEWDNKIAGDKYREIQAQKIVHNLVFVVDEKPDTTPVRVFVSNPDERKVFTPIRVIMRNEDSYQKLLQTALSELKAFERKYSSLSELSEVFDAIDAL